MSQKDKYLEFNEYIVANVFSSSYQVPIKFKKQDKYCKKYIN